MTTHEQRTEGLHALLHKYQQRRADLDARILALGISLTYPRPEWKPAADSWVHEPAVKVSKAA